MLKNVHSAQRRRGAEGKIFVHLLLTHFILCVSAPLRFILCIFVVKYSLWFLVRDVAAKKKRPPGMISRAGDFLQSDHLTVITKLSEWLPNSGAYMHWISAMPL